MNKVLEIPYYNWQRDALISLGLSNMAALYSLYPKYEKCFLGLAVLICLGFGISSVIKQIKSSKTKIINFDPSYWDKSADGEWVLTIKSEVMLFRVELPDGAGFYEEVVGDTKTSPNGDITFVHFSGATDESMLKGRVIIR